MEQGGSGRGSSPVADFAGAMKGNGAVVAPVEGRRCPRSMAFFRMKTEEGALPLGRESSRASKCSGKLRRSEWPRKRKTTAVLRLMRMETWAKLILH